MKSQSEYYNPKHWTVIYVLPIQRWDVEPWPVFVEIPLRFFEEASVIYRINHLCMVVIEVDLKNLNVLLKTKIVVACYNISKNICFVEAKHMFEVMK
jgi:hypothetical protein